MAPAHMAAAARRSGYSGKARCATARVRETMEPVAETVPVMITIMTRAETPEGQKAGVVVSRSVPQIAVVIRGVAARIV